MFTIHLNKLIFFAYHGVHEEERILGNTYEVNAVLTVDIVDKITSIEQTVNYVTVYEVIKKRMNTPTLLLETLVQDLAEEISMIDSRIKSINISIQKEHPPIPNFEGSISVSYQKDF